MSEMKNESVSPEVVIIDLNESNDIEAESPAVNEAIASALTEVDALCEECSAEANKKEDITEKTEAGKPSSSKFKNPEELLRAYSELEKEFTRRSQRLAKLENELAQKSVTSPHSEEEWKQTVDKFFERTPAAKPFAGEIAREILADEELKSRSDCLDTALTRVLLKRYRAPDELLSDGQFLKEHVLKSDAVKRSVIEDYIRGLREGVPPVVMSDGGEIAVAPRNKPRTLEEAGRLFAKNNK